MDEPADLGSPISVNRNGGFFENGKNYGFSKKWEVAAVYFRMWEDHWPVKPTLRGLSRRASVSCWYAKKVVEELTINGYLKTPL